MNDTAKVDPMTYFGERGFEFWQTGGGCTAFGCRLDDDRTYVLLSDEDGCNPPVNGKPVLVGIYKDDDDGDPVLHDGVTVTVATFDEVMPAAESLIAKHYKP